MRDCQLDEVLQRLGVPVAAAPPLQAYSALVAHWNGAAGLVSKDDLRRFTARHLLDSLALVPPIREREGLARIRHQLPAADADALALRGRAPSSRFDVLSSTPASSSGPRDQAGRRLDVLTTKVGDGCGLGNDERCGAKEGARMPAAGEGAGGSLPIADFGSGGGLPGIPLAVALPELDFLLVERSEKKARFLRRARDELTLPNVRVLCVDVRQIQRRSCRAVVARAAMPVPALWIAARNALAPGGYLLVLDRIVRSAQRPEAELPAGCDGARIRRRWTELPQPGAWRGVLELRETSP